MEGGCILILPKTLWRADLMKWWRMGRMSVQTGAKEFGSEQLISKRKESGGIQKLMKSLTLVNIGVLVNQMV